LRHDWCRSQSQPLREGDIRDAVGLRRNDEHGKDIQLSLSMAYSGDAP
jgi:hypothetical protein